MSFFTLILRLYVEVDFIVILAQPVVKFSDLHSFCTAVLSTVGRPMDLELPQSPHILKIFFSLFVTGGKSVLRPSNHFADAGIQRLMVLRRSAVAGI